MRQIVKKSLGTGGLKIIQAVSGVVVTILLARLLGIAGLGVFSFGLAVATAISIPTKNGLTELVVKEASLAHLALDAPRLHGVIQWVLRFSCIYSLVVGSSIAYVAVQIYPGSELALSVALSMLMLPGFSLLGNWSGGLRGLGRPAKALFSDTVVRPSIFMLIIIIVDFSPAIVLTPVLATFAMIVSVSISASVNWLLFKKSIPPELAKTEKKEIRHIEWLRSSLPFTATGGVQIATRQADIVLLGILVGETAVGIYRISLQGAMLVAFGSQAVNIVIAPSLAKMHIKQDSSQLSSLIRSSIVLSLCVAAPVLLIYSILGVEMLTFLFGDDATSAIVPLLILSSANALTMLNGAVVPLLNMTGNEDKTLFSFAIAFLSTIVLNLTLIPPFGTTGAAIAAFISIVVSNIALRHASITCMGIDPPATLYPKK